MSSSFKHEASEGKRRRANPEEEAQRERGTESAEVRHNTQTEAPSRQPTFNVEQGPTAVEHAQHLLKTWCCTG